MKSTKNKKRKVAGTEDKYRKNNKIWSEKTLEWYRAYQRDYHKNRLRQFTIRYDRINEKKLIEYLESQENVTKYLKELQIADMKKKKLL